MELKENNSKGKLLHLHCAKCQGETRHLVIQDVATTGYEIIGFNPDGHPETIEWADDYQIVQCQGCETISFRQLSWFSEHQNFDCDGTTERLYPQRSKNTLAINTFHSVPVELRRIYRETIDAFNYESLTLCAGGLRALVEGICSQQGVEDGPVKITKSDGTVETKRSKQLEGKIAGLHEKGILTKPHSELLHEHRFLGNEALHELQQPSPTELRLAIEIIEHTLEALYEIPKRVNQLKASKAKRMGNAGAP